MDLRLALYKLGADHGLDAARQAQLEKLAGLRTPPPGLDCLLPRGVAVLGAALVGLGLIFWIAANWDTLGRAGRFALLQGGVLAAGLGALWRPRAAAPAGLLAWLCSGALFAYFGQTYQTGADAWQLFALWAALTLPLCLALRSDVLWTPWALVAATAVSLWMQAHSGHRWEIAPDDLPVHLAGWAAALAIAAALGGGLRRWTGAGTWAQRAALTLAVTLIACTALMSLFQRQVPLQYLLAMLVLAGAAALCALPGRFDLYGLSASAFALDVLLIGRLTRALLERHDAGSEMARLALLGLAAAGLLAATVSVVLGLARRAAR